MTAGDGWDLDAEEEGDEDWHFPSLADIEADLAQIEDAAAQAHSSGKDDEDLRALLKQRATASGVDADVFFSTSLALKSVAADLHGILVQIETVQLDAAAVIASVLQGPQKPSSRPPAPAGALGLDCSKVFGVSARPSGPPLAALNAPPPAGASGSLDEYQRLLRGLPPDLFVDRALRLSVGDVHRYQDEKDINRDQLCVNGHAISGARGGYVAAVEALRAALQAADHAWSSADADEHAAQLLLSVLNRTSSGFAAFEEVLKLFDCLDVVVVSPESAQARPLEASVVEGVALGRAHTRYSVRRYDGSGEPLAVIDATFVFRVTTETLRRLSTNENGASWLVEDIQSAILLRRVEG